MLGEPWGYGSIEVRHLTQAWGRGGKEVAEKLPREVHHYPMLLSDEVEKYLTIRKVKREGNNRHKGLLRKDMMTWPRT